MTEEENIAVLCLVRKKNKLKCTLLMHVCQCLTLQERGALTRHLFFSLISHVIQTHFSERRASCCRETAQGGLLFSALCCSEPPWKRWAPEQQYSLSTVHPIPSMRRRNSPWREPGFYICFPCSFSPLLGIWINYLANWMGERKLLHSKLLLWANPEKLYCFQHAQVFCSNSCA